MIAGGARRDAVDTAMLRLVRLVLDDAWSARSAAAQLWEQIPDQTILRRARARVSSALADRVSPVAERAAATLDLALSLGEPGPAGTHLSLGAATSDREVPR